MFDSYIHDLENNSENEKPRWVRAVIWFTLTCFTMQPVFSLAQTVIKPANGSTQVITTQDPQRALVNIVKPNGAGVSSNVYNQFDVGSKGAVLNNNSSGQNVTIPGVSANGQTDVAPNNANLSGRSANLIINQVINSGPASQLNGFLAVAGQKAGVIVANPNGITCQGCGFINTTRGVLTTGIPKFDANGNLDHLSVTGGTLTINQLIDFGTPQIDLAAMNILVNGNIQGPNDANGKPTTIGALNLIAGANDINYADLKATPTSSVATNGQVAIDISLLGGMYAQQIALISTNKGAGVNSSGTIYSAKDLTIAADGNVSLAGTTNTGGDVNVKGYANAGADNINTNKGKLIAGGKINLNTSGALTNAQGVIQSQSGTTLTANTVDNTAGSIQTVGTGNLAINAQGNVLNNNGTLQTNDGALTVSAGVIDNSGGGKIIGQNNSSINLVAQTGALNNQGGTIQTTNGDLTATAQSINNTSGTIGTINGGATSLSAIGAVTNAQGNIQSANGLTINAASLDNTAGTIQTTNTGDMAITTQGDVVNSGGSLLIKKGKATIKAANVNNSNGGKITANNNSTLALNAQAGTLNNQGGSIASNAGAISINGVLNNRGGLVSAGQDSLSITQTSGNFVNEGVLQAGQDLTFNLAGTQTQTNSATGRLQAGHDLVVNNASNFTNLGGYNLDPTLQYGLYAGNNLTFNNGGILNNNGGVLRAMGNINLALSQLINGSNSAIVAVNGDVNASGMLDSSNGHALINQGVIYGGRDVVLRSEPQSGQTATFDNLGAVGNTPLIQAGRTLSLGRDCVLDANGQCTVTTWNTAGLGSVTVNNTGALKSNADTFIQANVFHNSIADPGKTTTTSSVNKTMEGYSGRYALASQGYVHVDKLHHTAYYVIGDLYDVYKDWVKTWTDTESFNAPVSSLRPNIIANGNLTVRTQNGDNIGGTLAAGKTFTLAPLDPSQASTFTNQSLVTYLKTYTQTGRDVYHCDSFADAACINESLILFDHEMPDGPSVPQLQVLQSIGGIIQSGPSGSANITIGTFNNNGSTDKQAPLASFTSNAGAFNDPTKNASFQSVALPTGNNGLFVINPQVQNGANYTRYLIIGNPLYGISASQVGSDYLIQHINASNAQNANVSSAIRLGVPDYEQQFIADQVLAATGLPYLGQTVTREGQLKLLMDNAISEAGKASGFVLGQALTPEQQKNLTKDIVWMVMMKVSGQDVLVPQLYLSPATLAAAKANGAQVLAGKDVTMTVKNLTNNGGNIEAGYGQPKTAQLAAAGAANGNLTINAANVDNISGSLKAAGDVAITADNVNNSTTISRAGDAANYHDYAGKTGLIEGGNNVNIKTTGGLNVQGGQITAIQGDVNADVAGKTNIESLKLQSKETTTTAKGGFLWSENSKTEHLKEEALTAGISAGNDVKINSQKGEIALTGANINAANNVTVNTTEGKYTDKALYLRDETTTQTKKSGFYVDTSKPATLELGFKTTTDKKSDLAKTGTGSTISAGNRLDTTAKNIEIEGGKYSGKEGYIHSLDGGNVVFKATEDTHTVTESTKTTKAGINLSAAGLVDLFTGKGTTATKELLSAKTFVTPQESQGSTATVSHKNAQLDFADKTTIIASTSTTDPNTTKDIREVVDVGGLDIKGRSAVEIKGGNLISTKAQDSEIKTGSAATTELKAGGNISFLNTSIGAGFQHDESQDRTVKTADNMTNISGRSIHIEATKQDTLDQNGKLAREALSLQGINLDAKKVAGNTSADNTGNIELDSAGRINITAGKTSESSSSTSKSFGGSIGTPSIAAPSPMGFNYAEKTVTDTKDSHINNVFSADPNGAVTIQAKGDTVLKGVEIDKTKDINISVIGGGFTSDAYQDKTSHTEKSTYVGLTSSQSVDKPTGFFHTTESSESTHQAGNTIKAKEGLNINTTGGDVTLVGGDYAANSAVMNTTGGNVITKAAQDTNKTTTETIKGQFVAAATAGVLGNSAGATYRSLDGLSTSTTVLGQQQASPTTPNDIGNNYKLNSTDAIDNSTLATARAGLEITYDKTTQSSVKNNNANIAFGSGTSITAIRSKNATTGEVTGGAVDLGGTNIQHVDALQTDIPGIPKAAPKVSVNAKEILTTKAVDSVSVDSVKNTTFIGAKAEAHSSIAGAAGDVADLSYAGAKGTLVSGSDAIKARAGGMIGLQLIGDLTNLAFSDLIGASAKGAVENTYTKASATETSENINHISAGKTGSVALTIQKDKASIGGAAGGDIHLTGVDMSDNGTVTLDSSKGNNITIDAAKNTKQSSQETIGAQAGVGTGAGVGLMSLISGAAAGAGAVPINGSVNASYRKDVVNETSYTNSAIQAANQATIKSAGDTVIKGGNVSAKDVALAVGGKLDIASVQDTKDDYSIQGHGGLSGGATVRGSSASLGGSLGGGKTWDKSQRVAQQSGIDATNTLSGNVQGDVNLLGGHITSQSPSTLGVGGKVNATALADKEDKDGLVMGLALSGSFNQSHSSSQSSNTSRTLNEGGGGTETTTTTTTHTTTNTLSGRAGLNIDTPEVNHYEATNNASIAGITLAQIDSKGQPVNGATVAVEGKLNTDINTAQKAQVKKDDKMKPMNIGITTPDIQLIKWKTDKTDTTRNDKPLSCEEAGNCPPPPPKPPVNPPVNPPVYPPVNPPVNPPVYPPVNPPVKPPVNPPVNPPCYNCGNLPPVINPPAVVPQAPPTPPQGVHSCHFGASAFGNAPVDRYEMESNEPGIAKFAYYGMDGRLLGTATTDANGHASWYRADGSKL